MKVINLKNPHFPRLLEIRIEENLAKSQVLLKKTREMKEELEESRKKRGQNGTQRI